MAYLKIRADHLFTGTELLDHSYVLIINDDGVVQDILHEPDTDAKFYSGIISPGFINCHCHLELSHMKGLIPEQTGLVDFVFKVVNERHLTDDIIAESIRKAEKQMLDCGIVAVGDICNNLSTLTQKRNQHLYYYNFIEASGWKPEVAQPRFEKAQLLYNEFESLVNDSLFRIDHSQLTIHNSIVPHAPYSVSEELWHLIQPYFDKRAVTIHNQETAYEDEFFQTGSGDLIRMYQMMNIQSDFIPKSKSSLQHYYSKLRKASSVILVHNTFTKQDDIDFIKDHSDVQQKTFFCLCVNANLYIEKAVPPISMLMESNCEMVLGTDSLASNHQLNILEEMKTILNHFPEINTTTLLKWATINGAKALQISENFGSFEKGKKPGVVWINNVENGKISSASDASRIV